VTYLPTQSPSKIDAPPLQARDVEKIRKLAGSQARIRGRVFRVGHSTKSNTYFLNFGPSRESLTAVIFASAVELFEKNKLQPKTFEGKEVELHGEIKDHPRYGLELIVENPAQIRMLD
jgi:DNA/RNA endonuclease YhcR with UshA esterase domain